MASQMKIFFINVIRGDSASTTCYGMRVLTMYRWALGAAALVACPDRKRLPGQHTMRQGNQTGANTHTLACIFISDDKQIRGMHDLQYICNAKPK